MAESFHSVWARASQIDGWLTEREARLLWDLTSGPWCEVGCFKGRSTLVLAGTGYSGYAVDWFRGSPEMEPDTDTRDEFERNLVEYDVTVLAERFQRAERKVPKVQLLHLDGDHSYTATAAAFNLYAPKAEVVVLHDAWGENFEAPAWPGVTQFVAELLGDPRWQHIANEGRSAAFKRCGT